MISKEELKQKLLNLYHNPNTNECKYLSQDEIEEYIKLGWIKGRK